MNSLLHSSAGVLAGAVFLLLPKCPACLSGYIAVATGLGVSLNFVQGLWMGALLVCGGVLGLLATKGACLLKNRVCELRRKSSLSFRTKTTR